MPRQIRIEYPGAIYHIMSRGDRRGPVFLDDVDRQDFLRTLAESCQKTGFLVHAYCLMPNHFHLVAETPEANLVSGMAWLLSTYTMRFNQRHKLSGHLFNGRYNALVVDGSAGFLKTVCDYVHFSPVRAGMLTAKQKLVAYPWSSLFWYGASKEYRPAWLCVARLLGKCGIRKDTAAGRDSFLAGLEARRLVKEDEASLTQIQRGWCFGSETFRNGLLARMDERKGELATGELKREHGEHRAERIIAEELTKLGWSEAELAEARKNAPGKLAMAARLRRETPMTLKWIAARIHLGTSNSANAKVNRWMRDNPIRLTPSATP